MSEEFTPYHVQEQVNKLNLDLKASSGLEPAQPIPRLNESDEPIPPEAAARLRQIEEDASKPKTEVPKAQLDPNKTY